MPFYVGPISGARNRPVNCGVRGTKFIPGEM
jgi:hypothetical protein